MMEDFKRKALLIGLIEKMKGEKSWCGETHIQKVIYFLQKVFTIPFGYDFILYKHGPYSFDLKYELGEMKAINLLTTVPQYPFGPSYVKGSLAEKVTDRFQSAIKKYGEQFEFIATEISACSVRELEKLATALYVKLENEISDQEECAYKINELKPHITLSDAKESIQRVEKLLSQSSSFSHRTH